LELDPRNFSFLQNLAISYHYLRNFPEEAATEDRALQLLPKDKGARLQRAAVDFEWHANTKPLHSEIERILAEDPRAAPETADSWILLALAEREYDSAKLAFAAMPADGSQNAGFSFPRSWFEAIIARATGDSEKARAAFSAARIEVEKTTQDEPNYGEPLSVLAMIDAGLFGKGVVPLNYCHLQRTQSTGHWPSDTLLLYTLGQARRTWRASSSRSRPNFPAT
jgi:tetratricopeptide (TPR) repeat protein